MKKCNYSVTFVTFFMISDLFVALLSIKTRDCYMLKVYH